MKYLQSSLFIKQLLAQAFLLLVLVLLPDSWQENFTWTVALILLCAVGIPHGANDLLYRKNKSIKGALVFLSLYLGSIAMYGILWYFIPWLALIIFLLVSVHHFGQSNFESISTWHGSGVLWGIFVLLWPVVFHTEEALDIFAEMLQISDYTWQKSSLLYTLGILLSLAYIVAIWKQYRSVFWLLLAQAVLVLLWYTMAPLLAGFVIVFALWHSSQSLWFQWAFFKKNNPFMVRPALLFTSNMILYTLLALGFLWLASKYVEVDTAFLFVLLALVTLPHVVVMDGIYKPVNEGSSSKDM